MVTVTFFKTQSWNVCRAKHSQKTHYFESVLDCCEIESVGKMYLSFFNAALNKKIAITITNNYLIIEAFVLFVPILFALKRQCLIHNSPTKNEEDTTKSTNVLFCLKKYKVPCM